MSFGDRLKQARKRAGYTQKQFAEKLNISPQNLAQYESGARNPSKERLQLFATALNLGYSYTKTGEPYFYGFVDTVPDLEYADNEMFNKSQYSDAEHANNENKQLAELELLSDAENALKILLNNNRIDLVKTSASYGLINDIGFVAVSENDLQELIASSSESCAVLAERLIRKKFKERHSSNIIVEYPDDQD